MLTIDWREGVGKRTRFSHPCRAVRLAIGLGLLAIVAFGCGRAPELVYVSSDAVLELPDEQQTQIREHLTRLCGTPARPKLLGNDTLPEAHLQLGAEVYQRRCAACHGVTGDGAGPEAQVMYPRPRDYRRGIFKFTTTPYGAKPRRDDLLRTVRNGAKGTSMPSFALLSDEEQQAVVDYVLALTHRGELELLLALEVQSEDEIDPERVPELVEEVLAPWQAARDEFVTPRTPMPRYLPESVELGKQAFLSETAGCYKCHGADGRGETTDNVAGFDDAWGFRTRAADLTSGMLHGGSRPEDIYRRIYSGINGTPMPSFDLKLADQPDTFWHLVHYVQWVAGERRRSVVAQQAAATAREPAQ